MYRFEIGSSSTQSSDRWKSANLFLFKRNRKQNWYWRHEAPSFVDGWIWENKITRVTIRALSSGEPERLWLVLPYKAAALPTKVKWEECATEWQDNSYKIITKWHCTCIQCPDERGKKRSMKIKWLVWGCRKTMKLIFLGTIVNDSGNKYFKWYFAVGSERKLEFAFWTCNSPISRTYFLYRWSLACSIKDANMVAFCIYEMRSAHFHVWGNVIRWGILPPPL